MKKTISLVLSIIILGSSMMVACGKKPDNAKEPIKQEQNNGGTVKEVFTGTPEEILNQIVDKSGVKENMPGTGNTVLTSENVEGYIGLSKEEFESNVSEAIVQEAMITAQAHMMSVVKAKSPEAATKVKALIAEKFNARRWVCVEPENCTVIKAGSYVMFVASSAEVSDAMVKAFKEIAGTSADSENTFFKAQQ